MLDGEVRRMVRLGMCVLASLWAVAALGIEADAQIRGCGGGPNRLEGRLVGPDGTAAQGVSVQLRALECFTTTNSDGRFAFLGLVSDSVTVSEGGDPYYCLEPKTVAVDSTRRLQTFRRISLPAPLSDAMLNIPSMPWVPPNYEQHLCLDAFVRHRNAPSNSMGRTYVRTPDEVLFWTLESPDVGELMSAAADGEAQIAIRFIYGPIRGPAPPAPVDYRLVDETFGDLYVLVLYSRSERLLVQVGRVVMNRPRGVGEMGVGEHGLKLEWRRTESGWEGPTVTERWSPPWLDKPPGVM